MANPETNNDAVYDASTLGTPKRLVLGVQHLFAMFGSTVLVPILTGLSVSATLLFAGVATLLMHLQHDCFGLGSCLVKDVFKHPHHKVHCREIIVVEKHIVLLGLAGIDSSLRCRRRTRLLIAAWHKKV